MSGRTISRPLDRVASVLRSTVLIACFVAILLGSYELVHPVGWSVSPLLVLITAVGLALTLGWSSRNAAARGRSADKVALMFGAASLILGTGATILIAYGVALTISEGQASSQTLIYRLTHPSVMVEFLAFALPAALSGGLGLWIARRRNRATGRTSMAAAAGRFSILGLGCTALIALAVALAIAYRWLIWG